MDWLTARVVFTGKVFPKFTPTIDLENDTMRFLIPLCTCATCSQAAPPTTEEQDETPKPLTDAELRDQLQELEERHAILAGLIVESELRVTADRARLVSLGARVARHRQELFLRQARQDDSDLRGGR